VSYIRIIARDVPLTSSPSRAQPQPQPQADNLKDFRVGISARDVGNLTSEGTLNCASDPGPPCGTLCSITGMITCDGPPPGRSQADLNPRTCDSDGLSHPEKRWATSMIKGGYKRPLSARSFMLLGSSGSRVVRALLMSASNRDLQNLLIIAPGPGPGRPGPGPDLGLDAHPTPWRIAGVRGHHHDAGFSQRGHLATPSRMQAP
jgi:hypothetical protein